MTSQQVNLLKRLIAARLSEVPVDHTPEDWRLVEVGWINGVNPRTAESLVDAELAVYGAPSFATEHTAPYIRLAEPGDW